MTFTQSTFPESKSSHLKRWHPKRKSSLRNQQFSACHVFGECTLVYCLSPPPTKKERRLWQKGPKSFHVWSSWYPKLCHLERRYILQDPVIFGIHSLTLGGLISIQYTSSCMGGKNIYQDPEPFNKWSSTCGEKKLQKTFSRIWIPQFTYFLRCFFQGEVVLSIWSGEFDFKLARQLM